MGKTGTIIQSELIFSRYLVFLFWFTSFLADGLVRILKCFSYCTKKRPKTSAAAKPVFMLTGTSSFSHTPGSVRLDNNSCHFHIYIAHQKLGDESQWHTWEVGKCFDISFRGKKLSGGGLWGSICDGHCKRSRPQHTLTLSWSPLQ